MPKKKYEKTYKDERDALKRTARKQKAEIELLKSELAAAKGRTAAEIAETARLERHVPSRRLPELRSAGLVRNGEARICRVTGNRSITWYPARK